MDGKESSLPQSLLMLSSCFHEPVLNCRFSLSQGLKNLMLTLLIPLPSSTTARTFRRKAHPHSTGPSNRCASDMISSHQSPVQRAALLLCTPCYDLNCRFLPLRNLVLKRQSNSRCKQTSLSTFTRTSTSLNQIYSALTK